MTPPSAATAGVPPMARHAAPGRAERDALALHPMAVLRGLGGQPLSVWFALAYVCVEYVRPQQLYPVLKSIPWGNLTLSGAVLFTVLEGRLRGVPRLIPLLLAAFSAVVLASSVFAFSPSTSFQWLNLFGQWLLVITALAGVGETRLRLLLLYGSFLLWNLKMSQHAVRSWAMDGFAFRTWGVNGAPGWFNNSGEFGVAMCVFFPMAAYFLVGLWPQLSTAKRSVLAAVTASAVIGMVGSSSRGALLGGAAVGAWVVMRSRHRVRVGIAVGALGLLAWGLLPEGNLERWRNAGKDETSTKRITYWKHGLEITNSHPLLGVGYKNWMAYYTARYNPQGQLPHNIFVEAMAELGYLGLAGFVALIVGTFVQNARTRRLTGPDARAPDRFAHAMAFGLDGALVGYLASGFFVTVLFYPYFWFNLGFTLALGRYATLHSASARPGAPGGSADAAATAADAVPSRARGGRGSRLGPPPAAPAPLQPAPLPPARAGQRGGLARR